MADIISFAKEQVVPNCRYGHGDLFLAQKARSTWGLVATGPMLIRNKSIGNQIQQVFSGNLYVCSKCGYTEFFDDNPQQSASQFGAA